MITVVIADDHRMVREAWKLVLDRDKRLSVAALCENGFEVVAFCRDRQPDVVLMDINMAPMNGIEATQAIRSFSASIRIIGISVHTDLSYIHALLKAGGNGYVTKNSSGEEMIHAIFQVMEGLPYYCKDIAAYQL